MQLTLFSREDLCDFMRPTRTSCVHVNYVILCLTARGRNGRVARQSDTFSPLLVDHGGCFVPPLSVSDGHTKYTQASVCDVRSLPVRTPAPLFGRDTKATSLRTRCLYGSSAVGTLWPLSVALTAERTFGKNSSIPALAGSDQEKLM